MTSVDFSNLKIDPGSNSGLSTMAIRSIQPKPPEKPDRSRRAASSRTAFHCWRVSTE
jgi:hypothetical protein